MACLILVPECLRQLRRSLEVIVLHRFVVCNLTKQIGPDVVLKFGWVNFFFYQKFGWTDCCFHAGVPDADGGCSAGQSLNPAFVHALAVPEVDMVDRVGKVCVVARGDGVVEVIDIEPELASSKSKNSLKPHKGAQSKAKGNASSVQTGTQDQNGRKKLCLDNSLGGHTASASCV